eukprot:11211209-Heterocapsa_arctica.AAC.1
MGLPANNTPSDAWAFPRILLAAARRNHMPQAFSGCVSVGIAECRLFQATLEQASLRPKQLEGTGEMFSCTVV